MTTSKSSSVLLLAKSAITGALGGLLFGFDTAVIAGITHALTDRYQLSPANLGFTVSIALWGTVIGSMVSGTLGQRLGSRKALRVMAVLYVVSALGCAFAGSWSSFLFFRFLGGLGIGGSSVLGPVYIAELAPAKWRGRMVGLFQINVVVGILLAYLSNAIVAHFALGPIEWRVQIGVAFVPALLFLIMLLSVPQSSRWLITQNRIAEATLTLQRMGSPDSEAEVAEIIESIRQEKAQSAQRLFSKQNQLPVFLAISIGIFNQLTGINAILYYLNDIFASAGFSQVSSNLQAVAIGAMNLVATLAGVSLIDKVGRKKLLLVGAVGCGLCLLAAAIIFQTNSHAQYLLAVLIAYIIFFAFSQGAVIWVYISEVFPTSVRSKGQSLGSSSHWITNALIASIFPILARYSKSIPFFFFAAMMVVQFLVVLFVYPETKGFTLESMQKHLHEKATPAA
jgi:sugar porter (SP) family MFS transporter